MTDTTDSDRATFEAWARDFYGDGDESAVDLSIDSLGFYMADGIEDAWKGWQARGECITMNARFYIEQRGAYFVVCDRHDPHRLKEKHPDRAGAEEELRRIEASANAWPKTQKKAPPA